MQIPQAQHIMKRTYTTALMHHIFTITQWTQNGWLHQLAVMPARSETELTVKEQEVSIQDRRGGMQTCLQSVGHGRKQSDQATANCPPCEDALLALGVVEEGFQGFLNEHSKI